MARLRSDLTHTPPHTLTDAQAVSSINRAVESNHPAATLEAIKAPTTNIRSITDSCTDTYLEKLSAARQEKVDKGEYVWCVVCGVWVGKLTESLSRGILWHLNSSVDRFVCYMYVF